MVRQDITTSHTDGLGSSTAFDSGISASFFARVLYRGHHQAMCINNSTRSGFFLSFGFCDSFPLALEQAQRGVLGSFLSVIMFLFSL